MRNFIHNNKGDLIMIAFFIAMCIALCFVNLRPEVQLQPGSKERAVVLEVDNSGIMQQGILMAGGQKLKIKILSGEYTGETFDAYNQLRSQMELDKLFQPGDKILASVFHGAKPGVSVINAQDHYRIGWTFFLFALFGILLIVFGGITGLKALISFVFSCLVVWNIMVPLCLKGFNPILISMLTVTILSAAIIYIVAGINPKGHAAFSGTILGVTASSLMAMVFTGIFHLNGAVMPYSQALYYSGYAHLNLPQIYIGAISLAASGAVMDLAMDVAAGMHEVVTHRPDISRRSLIASGMRIGRSVVGTMTTTLLLAYSGGYLTLMMTFAAEGTKPVDFINNPYVASEVVKTIIGSFGLVLVAPFTALMGGVFLPGKQRNV